MNNLAKRIIPCFDVDAWMVVNGINFMYIKDVGDQVECASLNDRQGQMKRKIKSTAHSR